MSDLKNIDGIQMEFNFLFSKKYTKYNLLNKSSPNLNISALFRLINAVRKYCVHDFWKTICARPGFKGQNTVLATSFDTEDCDVISCTDIVLDTNSSLTLNDF